MNDTMTRHDRAVIDLSLHNFSAALTALGVDHDVIDFQNKKHIIALSSDTWVAVGYGAYEVGEDSTVWAGSSPFQCMAEVYRILTKG